MSSKLEIINLALDRLGVAPITTLTEGTDVQQLCDRTYEHARVFLLRSHRLTFSILTVTGVTVLGSSVNTSTFPRVVKYDYSDGIGRLNIKTDQFKPLLILECDRDYKVEGDEIVFEGSGDIEIKYIADITTPSQFDSGFIMILSIYIAYLMSERLTQSISKIQMLKEEYLAIDHQIKLINHIESNEVIKVIRG